MAYISTVAVIGLGAIGWGAALSLIREGYSVYGVDINQNVLDRFAKEDGIPCATPLEAARQARVIMVFVVNEQQLEQVLFGDNGAVAEAEEGTLFILSSTIAPSGTTRIAGKLQSSGMKVLDAPVAGGPSLALSGELTVLVSGRANALEIADPMFDAISARVHHLGDEPGQASTIKMINQLLTDVHLAAAAEAFALARKTGVDLETMVKVVSNSTGGSWVFESRAPRLIERNYSPRSPINNVTKDLGIVDREAELAGLALPMTRAALIMFLKAAEAGFGQEDGIAVSKIIEGNADD